MLKEKPFIHLFTSPNAKYFFDVNTNEIVPVDADLHEILGKILADQAVALTSGQEEQIANLESMGYLSNHRVKSIRHSATDLLETYMKRKLAKITLQVTQNCNLRCTYCIYADETNEKQRMHSDKCMSFEIAKKGIDFLIKHSIDSETIDIGFYGGEPLMEFELLKKIIAYAEEAAMDKKLTFSITTNGTMVTEEVMEYFIQHEVSIAISLDGPQGVHDGNRRFAADNTGSFSKVMETLKWIYEKYPDYIKKMLIGMVIDPKYSYDYINSLFKEYVFLEEMLIMPNLIDDSDSMIKNIFADDYVAEKEYKMFLGLLNCFDRLDDIHISPLVKREIDQIETKREDFDPITGLPGQSAPSGPCIPGQVRLFMDVEGNLFPCERVNELSEVMKIGHIEEGFFLDRVESLLNVGVTTAEKCSNCQAFIHCTLCAKQADGGDELSAELKCVSCDYVRDDFDNLLNHIVLFQEYLEFYPRIEGFESLYP